MWGLWRRARPDLRPKESAFAFKELMKLAAQDIANDGEIRGARIIEKGPNKAKTHIGWLKRQILRGEFRRRA